MILGVGIDLCEIERMRELLDNPRFLARFFCVAEQEYIQARGVTRAQTAAGIYAAKEAFAKALGTGLAGMTLKDIQIDHDALGAPVYALCGSAARAAESRGIRRLHLSITHDGGVAAAVAIAEGEA